MASVPMRSVSSTQLVRDLPGVKQQLDKGPLQITSHGRDEFVVLSNDDFDQLRNLVGVDAKRLDGKLTTVLESIDTMVMLFDKDLNIRRANRALCDYFGFDPQSLIGTPISDLLVTPTDQYVFHRVKSVLESGTPERFELPSSHRQNRYINHLITPWPNGVAHFASDVTERTEARDLALAFAAQQTAIRGIDGVALANLDHQGRFVGTSGSLQTLLASSAEQIEGTSILSIVDAEHRSMVQKMLAFTDKPNKTAEIRYLHKGTDLHRARISLSPYQTTHNNLEFAMALQDFDLGE